MSIFSKNLRYLRKRGNHNQDVIALLFRKRANTIGNWENMKSEPSLTELMKLGEFFEVSVEDLLHNDLEKKSGFPYSNSSVSTGSGKSPVASFSAQDPMQTSPSTEASPDAFWLILRELRVISEKLDSVVGGIEAGGYKKNSDKSYH
ncbi:MAG TPA: helix-turn-helix transcriptional regulator [Puia sp.]|jgi:transcriptional regulator with XRE-family HTH domain